jgi:hypothetical protein
MAAVTNKYWTSNGSVSKKEKLAIFEKILTYSSHKYEIYRLRTAGL